MRAVLALVLAACAGEEGSISLDSAHSGARLKLAWYELDDGQRTWAIDPFTKEPDLVDAMLGVPCAPAQWSDNIERCTPELGGVLYEDEQCTQPVLLSPKQFNAERVISCEQLQPVGPVYTASDRRRLVPDVFQRTTEGCTREPRPPGQTMVNITEVAETREPSEVFVTLSHQIVGEGRIAVDVLRGNDNLIVPLRLRDTQYGVDCQLAEPGVERMPCEADEAALASHFADETCREPIVEPVCGKPPRLAAMSAFGCRRYFEVGDALTDVAPFDELGYVCRPALSMPPLPIAYTLGARVEPAQLERVIEPAATRTQLVYIAHGDARVRKPSSLFDSVFETECELDRVVDNQMSVCRPAQLVAGYQTFLFSDPACTQRLPDMMTLDTGLTTCGERALPSIVSFVDRSHRVGPRYTGEAYDGSNAFCSPIPWPLYEIGERVDAQLPMAMKRRDP